MSDRIQPGAWAVNVPERFIRMAQTAPCNDCQHESYCATGWSCAPYRKWQKSGKECKNPDKRVPDWSEF